MQKKSLKLAIIGGGSSYTPELVEGVLKRLDKLPVREMHFVDVAEGEEKLEIIAALAKRMVEKVGADIEIKASLDRRSAIKDADFIMTQFRVGGLKARANDERIPIKYNVIGQETTGPGGFAKALRTIPVILDICKDIEELAPNAWMLNFTNPAGLVTEAVHRHTKVKSMGLCNVPVSMTMMVAEMMDCEPHELQLDFAGLNHLVWVHQVWLHGEDITETVLEKVGDGANFSMKNIFEEPWDPDFLHALGVIPCPYHRYFYQTEAMLAEEKQSAEEVGTRAEQVMQTEKELFELYRDVNLDHKPEQLEQRGGAYYSDASLNLVDAIHNNLNAVHVVNVRNNGAIHTLPDDAVIECSSVVGSFGAKPLAVGAFPAEIRGLIHQVKAYEELAVEAAVTGSYEKSLMALANNPLVPDIAVAKAILDEILESNKPYLPQFS
ncbi:6-phospho-beta-glucosidase [Vibrio nigripulchritudo SFn27]|uniref:6-phospho-beta-glucosidase n=1 Tax=Vibrio nigripulchritudo TaxID=28173 RepID=U4K8Y3_9VIBR|nr:6-phospho-beta-glucosidase [Vibrio nigripulchritudo]KJY66926.1 diacetylchitobiose-6-phosphate hydrolase [Vibrio nigripulchritudo]CCN80523.1 6-phospho-beta-glucosidase [Vibrio nigripulchritudo BLFn1]CCN89988.1 6-phospho-beta-glucosidase [Vibrio nigripulchritudo SFn27]CCN93663.1 6-phospho-beta-glucosidase [Vibrio nigripulchritudo ENn2]CCO42035.1 6-phospho-beta-glucosidase [Vibrio nigripulchritudo SFn135]